MKVLVLGASGFIGLPVAQAFVRAGHIVYGQTRSAEKAKLLAAEEIIPVVAEVENTAAYLPLVATLDAVVDVVGGMNIQATSALVLSATLDAVKQHRSPSAPKLTYVYTSGIWVHGDNRKDIITDTTPLAAAPDLISWRGAQEQAVVTNPAINGVVIRPAMLYGRSGSILSILFKNAYEGKVAWPGIPGGRYAVVHCDDLAELYLLATEKAPLISGQIIDGANDVTESVDDLLEKLVQVSGAKGPYEYIKPTNPFEVAIGTSTLIRPYLGRTLLGWRPLKAGLIDHLEIYYNAWKASQGL